MQYKNLYLCLFLLAHLLGILRHFTRGHEWPLSESLLKSVSSVVVVRRRDTKV